MNEPLTGFWNYHESETRKGLLPKNQNSPQKCPEGLYAEQLSGSSFLARRFENLRSWLYRRHPSVTHSAFYPYKCGMRWSQDLLATPANPTQLRWDPLPRPQEPTDFLEGTELWVSNGDPKRQSGCAVYLFSFSHAMENQFFYNADGELIFVPESGTVEILSEFGRLEIAPHEIGIVPRGVKFRVGLRGEFSRGYLGENYGAPMRLPDLGPIGSNGLANPRHFIAPTACEFPSNEPAELIAKFLGECFSARVDHSPLDVLAWHGNYYPYKYNLDLFNTMGTVSFDHPDPSIYTVLTSPSSDPGFSNMDLVIFPPRWMVAENSFRPPYYHRNMMSEFMGLIQGAYDAKEEGFVPGGSSLHNCMSPHGPDAQAFKKASSGELKPHYLDKTLAFMFESRYPFSISEKAALHSSLQKNYLDCWRGL